MKLKNGIQLLKGLAEVVAPARCMGCLLENTWLCDKCFYELRTAPLTCVGCRKKQPSGRTCPECRRKINLTGVVSVGGYESQLLRRGVYWLKFKSIRDVAEPLAGLMVLRMTAMAPLRQLQQEAALVPVPLHKKRQLERGFNQSLELSEVISRSLNLPIYNLVRRSRKTWTQAKLPRELRGGNLKNSFDVISGASLDRTKLIVVDDVTTSGSTLDAVARPLWELGAKEVWGLTVARG